jgi:predicted transcriptional regulator
MACNGRDRGILEVDRIHEDRRIGLRTMEEDRGIRADVVRMDLRMMEEDRGIRDVDRIPGDIFQILDALQFFLLAIS